MLTLTSDVIGYIAACLTTSAFVPQAWLTWQHKRAEGVSIGMYLIMVCGVLVWMVYGILLHAWPIIIANAVTLALAMFILVMKIIYK
ncbi:SemiSWEET transporter [Undibacterium sp. CY21W]|uniref:SemiSWEET transporter n=1 Tax=Undibacterium sp. CY21W TaxID=2762293 RepID=UPI00164BA789|nr:SemiSWEET transporter [Undibacterium sp. CY21W]MBC3927457.1 SemiSWEET transporter [Undibacterium sp. CY21W]